MNHENHEPPSRREFLTGAALGAGGLLLGAVTIARGDDEKREEANDQAPVLKISGRKVALDLDALQEVAKVGGSQVVLIEGDKLIVARTAADKCVVFSAVCTHKGCVVEYFHESSEFRCPCHGARFDLNGNVTRGPAKRPLKKYATHQALLIDTTK